jgi:hypothetical protein
MLLLQPKWGRALADEGRFFPLLGLYVYNLSCNMPDTPNSPVLCHAGRYATEQKAAEVEFTL